LAGKAREAIHFGFAANKSDPQTYWQPRRMGVTAWPEFAVGLSLQNILIFH
jgi:hypothetical protein